MGIYQEEFDKIGTWELWREIGNRGIIIFNSEQIRYCYAGMNYLRVELEAQLKDASKAVIDAKVALQLIYDEETYNSSEKSFNSKQLEARNSQEYKKANKIYVDACSAEAAILADIKVHEIAINSLSREMTSRMRENYK